ncbi:MAG: DNA polymerase III subunit gamma/tau [Methylococcus sp.]|nr:MAG: DNA polymerase III subunit gamma/tau [Methylococcus sp.]
MTHALEFDRLHHAYLFTGTRGVGKTTIARILAKAMNCENRQGVEPCGQCLMCRELDEGRFPDLVEVDAASRTKVEDTRELLDNVLYAPTQGRYKIYIIDEVHMLSSHSFNALLKTLEEPPPHIKFLLATTDPQKIPVTVLSRCLQFNLKRLTPEQIRGQMEDILHHEAIVFEANAVKSLARAADGSLRDGLSLMDQAIVHGGGQLAETTVATMLGTVARRPVFEMLEALVAQHAGSLLGLIESMDEHAPNYADVLQQLLIILHHAALGQWAPDAVRRDEDAEQILDLSRRVHAEDLQLFYQIGLIGQRDLPLAPDPRTGFEMTLLRMLAFRPTTATELPGQPAKPVPPVARPSAKPPSPLSAPTTLASVADDRRRIAESEPAAPGAVTRSAPPAPSLPPSPNRVASPSVAADIRPARQASGAQDDWPALIQAMGLAAMTRELANNCVLVQLDEQLCELSLEPRLQHLCSPRAQTSLETALQKHFNRPVKLQIRLGAPDTETPALRQQRETEERQQAAVAATEQDDIVRALQETFDARIVPGSIKPIH